MGIEGLSQAQAEDVIGTDGIQKDCGIGAFGLEDAHMGDIEQPSRLAGGEVFFEHRAIPNWHFPAGKWDDFGSQLAMGLIQGRTFEGCILWLGPTEFGQTRFADIRGHPGEIRLFKICGVARKQLI